jgi:hypothetical protein
MKKILITFEDYYSIAFNLSEALKSCHDIKTEIFISNKEEHWLNRWFFRKVNKLSRNFRLTKKGVDLFASSPFSYKKYMDLRFIKRVEEFQPDLIFCIQGQRFGEGFLQNSKIPKIAWWIEPDPDRNALVHYARVFDLYLSYDSEVVNFLNSIGIRSEYQSHVTSPLQFYPIPNLNKEFDLFFYGGWSAWREEVLFTAYQESKNIALYGSSWLKKCTLFSRNDLIKIYKGEKIEGPNLNQAINQSIIVLNAQRLKGFTTGLDTRAFDVLASGALLLTDAPKDLFRHFKDGEHLLIYGGLGELNELIRNILDKKINIDLIKAAGKRKVLKNYTYTDLCHKVLGALADR